MGLWGRVKALVGGPPVVSPGLQPKGRGGGGNSPGGEGGEKRDVKSLVGSLLGGIGGSGGRFAVAEQKMGPAVTVGAELLRTPTLLGAAGKKKKGEPEGEARDPCAEVAMAVSTMHRLGFIAGCWVRVRPGRSGDGDSDGSDSDGEETGPAREGAGRLARVVPLREDDVLGAEDGGWDIEGGGDGDGDEDGNGNGNGNGIRDRVYIPPGMAFNLGMGVASPATPGASRYLGTVELAQVVGPGPMLAELGTDGGGGPSGGAWPPVSARVQLSRVRAPEPRLRHLMVEATEAAELAAQGPMAGPQPPPKLPVETREEAAALDAALQDYFATPRVVNVGDVIAVPLGVGGGPVAYLAVVFVAPAVGTPPGPPQGKGTSFTVLKDRTRVARYGSVQSPTPPGAGSFVQAVDAKGMEASAEARLSSASGMLARLVRTCVHPSALPLALSSSFLLHGPRGAGKATACRAACASLGVHLIEVNCSADLNLEGGGQGQPGGGGQGILSAIDKGLRRGFETAALYSPSVLLLRRFDLMYEALRDAAAMQTGALDGSSKSSAQDDAAGEVAFILRGLVDEFSRKGEGHGWARARTSFGFGAPQQHTGVIVVASADGALDEGCPGAIRACFTHELLVGAPDEDQRLVVLKNVVREIGGARLPEASLKDVARKTGGMLPLDLKQLALVASQKAARREMAHSGGRGGGRDGAGGLTAPDMELALKGAQESFARRGVGVLKVPKVSWSDVGGLESVKDSLRDTLVLPLKHRALFSSGLRKRSGVLLFGPPGTGKTLMAKAVATECNLNFMSVKGPELINMYVGESERNVREVFRQARSALPCVVFFDELDALAPARGQDGDSGGVMDRVVSQLLAEVDGLSTGAGDDLFIIGATNRPDLLDASLLRPGRFDRLLYVGASEDATNHAHVIRALTKDFRMARDVNLDKLAESIPLTFSGADMYALCADAWLAAVRRTLGDKAGDASYAAPVADGGAFNPDYSSGDSDAEDEHKVKSAKAAPKIEVTQVDFLLSAAKLKPSLNPSDLAHYERLRAKYSHNAPNVAKAPSA